MSRINIHTQYHHIRSIHFKLACCESILHWAGKRSNMSWYCTNLVLWLYAAVTNYGRKGKPRVAFPTSLRLLPRSLQTWSSEPSPSRPIPGPRLGTAHPTPRTSRKHRGILAVWHLDIHRIYSMHVYSELDHCRLEKKNAMTRTDKIFVT